MTLPTLYLPHGAGPCFFMEWTAGPPDTWERMAAWLRGIGGTLPEPPRALLVVSAHWEAPVPTVTSAGAPPLLYDYYGFPQHTYELTWPAPGDPALAATVCDLLGAAGIDSGTDDRRGFDHGVFIPLKVAFPEAPFPTVQLSLRERLDPREHIAIGRALAPLRDQGVLILGSGMSYHNMRAFRTGEGRQHSERFDAWMTKAVELDRPAREEALAGWNTAPSARESHPREEHLLPLMVAAGAAPRDAGRVVFRDEVMGFAVSAVQFG
jgi:aromatic ring-opening dioxygenase catalytic subunit (LigB family)